jgi:intracellular septation protein
MKTGTRMLLDLGPLAAFFIGSYFGGPIAGTGVFMAAFAISLAVTWHLTRKIGIMPMISAGFVAVFGTLTLVLRDQTFIQVKVTLINVLFGTILLGGLFFGRNFLKLVIEGTMHLPDFAWRTLTIRWGVFFFALAALNEVLRHTLDFNQWVLFKGVGLLVLTFLFAMANAPFMARHMIEDEKKPLD